MGYEAEIADLNARIVRQKQDVSVARGQLEAAARTFARESLVYDNLRAEALALRERELMRMRGDVIGDGWPRTQPRTFEDAGYAHDA